MPYKCVIIDDEELARELIATHLNRFEDFELVASCASAIEAHKILQETSIDLLFLDIEMPVLKGIDFYKSLENKPKVIFTTAYRDYAFDGFELNAIDFLLKPIVFARFLSAIEKFKASVKPLEQDLDLDHIYIQSNKKHIKIDFDKVLFVESLKDYIKIYLENDTLTIKHGLGAFANKLDSRFCRIHRSFIVNLQKVTAYTKNDVEIGDKEIPIGDLYREDVISSLESQ